jgi:hypothetical protein
LDVTKDVDWGEGGSEWFLPPRAAESKGTGRINILNENKVDFLRSSHFKLLSKVKGDSLNVIILELVSVVGGHWDYWHRGTKIVATPLNVAVSPTL